MVGIYADADIEARIQKPSSSYSCNTIFVPRSLLPIEESELEGHEFTVSEVSFEVGNAEDIKAFESECLPQIEQMGFIATYYDGGWQEVEQAYESARSVSLIRIAVLTVAAVIAVVLVTYLFIARKSKKYGIMRALGTTKGKSNSALMVPLTVLTVAATVIGIVAGWVYTAGKVESSIPVLAAIVCALGVILLTLILAVVQLGRLGKMSPLELLQGGNRKKAKK